MATARSPLSPRATDASPAEARALTTEETPRATKEAHLRCIGMPTQGASPPSHSLPQDSLPLTTTFVPAEVRRQVTRHRRTSSIDCARSLELLLAGCSDILASHARATELLQARGRRPLPLGAVSSTTTPSLVTSGDHCAGVEAQHSPLNADADDQVVSMDSAPPKKRGRDPADGSGEEQEYAEDTAGDISTVDPGTAADARAPIPKRRNQTSDAPQGVKMSQAAQIGKTRKARSRSHVSSPAHYRPLATSTGQVAMAASARELPQRPAASSNGAPATSPSGAELANELVRFARRAAELRDRAAAASALLAEEEDGDAAQCVVTPMDFAATGVPTEGRPNAEPSSDDVEGQWTQKISKAHRRKARKLAATRPIHQPAVGTCLFRPTDRSASFLAVSREAVARELAAVAGVSQVRMNTRLNVVAADAETAECLSSLLATEEICGIPVRAYRPVERGTSRGLIFGVDPQLTSDEIMANVKSDVPISETSRQRNGAVVMHFAGPVPPAFVAVYKLLLPVRACRPRPVQCGRCGRLDHVTAGCKGTVRCARCGGGHNSQQCTAGVARCSNCSGRHSVTDPRCPRWQHERRVATSMAQALKPVPRAEVEASVLSAQPSYAEMVRRCSTQQQTRLGPQTPQGRLQPRSPAQRKAARRATAQQPAPPAVPVVALAAPGPEQLMPVLLALTHSLVGRLPADDPARMAATDALALLSPPAHLHHG